MRQGGKTLILFMNEFYRRIVIPVFVGSSPIIHPNKINSLMLFVRCEIGNRRQSYCQMINPQAVLPLSI